MAAEKKKGGKYPRGHGIPKYQDPAEVEKLIDAYFKACEGHILTDPQTGKYVYDKFGQPIIIDSHPPTVTGLALALGFTNRQSLLNYQGRPAFRDIITKAKSRVEQYTEERLFDRDGSNGAQFSLKWNFKGWGAEQQSSEGGASAHVNIICDIPRVPVQDSGENIDAISPQKIDELIKSVAGGGDAPNGTDV